jgi:hypothetical protein
MPSLSHLVDENHASFGDKHGIHGLLPLGHAPVHEFGSTGILK